MTFASRHHVRRRRAPPVMKRVCLLLLAGCSFQHGSGPGDASVDPPPDAVADASRDASRDAAVDAAMDAAIDAAPTCPATYQAMGGSRYRFAATAAGWLAAEQDCEDDGTGTHLVVLSAATEASTVDAITAASRVWIGTSNRVQPATWLWVTGGAAPPLDTDPNQCGERYDGAGGGTPGLQNSDCTNIRSYLCECDLTAVPSGTY